MKVENESSTSDVQCVQSVQNDESECGPSGADLSCAKSDNDIASSWLDGDVSVMSCAKPTEGVGGQEEWALWLKNGCGGSKSIYY